MGEPVVAVNAGESAVGVDEAVVGDEAQLAAREADPAPARPAATVVLLRPAAGGVETFLLARDPRSRFGAGMSVFPGGVLDSADSSDALCRRCPGLTLDAALGRLSERGCDPPSSREVAFGLHVAALRELFEEAGVVVGTVGGRAAEDVSAEVSDELADARADLPAGRLAFLDLVERADLCLEPERLVPFAHWITPRALPRRYDTRFFAVGVAADQDAVHCGVETTAGAWMGASEALARCEAGTLNLMHPTRIVLEALAAFDAVSDALEWARTKPIRTVTPTRRDGDWALDAEGGDGW